MQAEQNSICDSLLTERAELEAMTDQSRDDSAPVALDQTSIGRLSRIDALQKQAMAQATKRRRQERLWRIDAALQRLDRGEFGLCIGCGEDINPRRLALDPTLPNCISCAQRSV